MTSKTLFTVVKTPCCEHMVFACAIHRLDDGTLKEIGEMIRQGCSVQQLTVQQVQAIEWGCECEQKKEAK